MIPASRRIFLYWILLLVPALIVGTVAIQLLRREEGRLRQQGLEVEEARRVALETQARLIVENLELLVDDVQFGLLDILAGAPADALEEFMARWENSHPLVRTAFRCGPDGRLLRPSALGPGAEAQGFVRRFARELTQHPPWNETKKAESAETTRQEEKRVRESSAVRKVAGQNVQQMQSARRDLRQLALGRDYAAGAAAPAAVAEARTSAESADRAAEMKDALTQSSSMPVAEKRAETNSASAQAARRGWRPVVMDGRLHVLGWVQEENGDIRGVELQLAGLVGRLGGALPAEVVAGDGFAVRDDQGRILHQRGNVPAQTAPRVRLPLAVGILPGWEVCAYLAPGSAPDAGGGLWAVGTLLVAIFVTAIVAGGSLLLWQARRSEEEASQKTSFVANVSHEFKTPLTTIRLYAELLEQGRVRDPAQGGEYLRTIGRETQRLARLVNNALDFSRLEQGRRNYVRERVDLASQLRRLLETHGPRIREAGLELRCDLPAAELPVITDRDALDQIVLNLLDNACKYAAAGAEITVAAHPGHAGGGEVRVADRGPGVPPGHRERIFEKFHRVDDTLTAERTGAGLGLSIARQLARGLGGDLRYAPREGGGSEFVLHLP